jgi:hypothetical protein
MYETRVHTRTHVRGCARARARVCVCCGKGPEHDRESWRVLDAVNPLGWRMWVTRGSPRPPPDRGSSFATNVPCIREVVNVDSRACEYVRVYIITYNNIPHGVSVCVCILHYKRACVCVCAIFGRVNVRACASNVANNGGAIGGYKGLLRPTTHCVLYLYRHIIICIHRPPRCYIYIYCSDTVGAPSASYVADGKRSIK